MLPDRTLQLQFPSLELLSGRPEVAEVVNGHSHRREPPPTGAASIGRQQGGAKGHRGGCASFSFLSPAGTFSPGGHLPVSMLGRTNWGRSDPIEAPPSMVGMFGYFLNESVVSLMSCVKMPPTHPASPPAQRPCDVLIMPRFRGVAPL